jgi:hypothetical protein
VAIMPAAAGAREPKITSPPTVSGDAIVGRTVTASDYDYTGGRDTTTSWYWIRCQGVDLDARHCEAIPGATEESYEIVAADTGKRLRVLLYVHNRDGDAYAISGPSDEVEEAPKPPPPPPPPVTPQPVASPTPGPVPAPAANVLTPPVPAGAVLEKKSRHKLRMLRPAPVVRIRGHLTRRGARVTLLSVSAPRGAAIAVSCRGRSCPVRKWARATTLTRLLRFERVLAPATRLTIRVTKPGRVGKYTEIVIRSGKAPWRRDRCLNPGSSRPRRCPSV